MTGQIAVNSECVNQSSDRIDLRCRMGTTVVVLVSCSESPMCSGWTTDGPYLVPSLCRFLLKIQYLDIVMILSKIESRLWSALRWTMGLDGTRFAQDGWVSVIGQNGLPMAAFNILSLFIELYLQ